MPNPSFWTRYIMPTPVYVFSSAYIRDHALEDPTDGDLAYLTDVAEMTVWHDGAWIVKVGRSG